MNIMKRLLCLFFLLPCFLLLGATPDAETQHPSLFISKEGGRLINKNLSALPLLRVSFQEAKGSADKAMAEPMEVPPPKDPAGGYTHDRHKANYAAMQNAGLVYAITGEPKYARFAEAMLLQYAALNPTLKNHPQARGSSPGRLFHQALNDANWLVYASQAYNCVYAAISPANRKKIEEGAFRPLTDYLTKDLESWFNLLHNHGVWACAAVGMTGMAIGDDNLVQQALYGTKKDGKSGFIAQLNHLFSPDGYYTEGPYYARYALLPFYLFAQAIDNSKPSLKIFEHRDQILKKALYAALQQTAPNGVFFPINDAIKDKTYNSSELVVAVDIAYRAYKAEAPLLAIAASQGRVLLNRSGVAVASALHQRKGKVAPFPYASVAYTDGPNGTEGGVSLLRTGSASQPTTLLLKYAAHGLSHGHYDKLNVLLYHDGREILQDYGAARFLNVEQKDGGRYLKENKSFAMQTVAHNTVVVDEASQFGGIEEKAEAHHPTFYFNALGGVVQAASAKEEAAYPGVAQHRTVLLLQDKNGQPVYIDLFRLSSDKEHQYDLPFWYNGQLIETSFPYVPATTRLEALGKKHGYQHIWKEATGKTDSSLASFTFLTGRSFYSVSTNATPATEFILGRSGAADPQFNLRRETAFIVRKKGSNELFVSVLMPHGSFDSQSEVSSGSRPPVRRITVLQNDEDYTAVRIHFINGDDWTVLLANKSVNGSAAHELLLNGRTVSWKGPYTVLQKH